MDGISLPQRSAQGYHITEKHQEFNLLERLGQVILEVLVSAGREWPARENPGRQAEVLL
jgi:hypothetical protein